MATLKSPCDVNWHVGLAIQVAREARRMTRAQLASAIGVSTERLVLLEDGNEEASAVDLHLLAKALNLDVAAFFVGLTGRGREDGDPRGTCALAFPDLLNVSIGARLRRAREASGLSPAALAILSGLRPSRIQRIEAGKSEAAASELFAIGEVLGLPVAFFFDGVSEEEDSPTLFGANRLGPSSAAA
jgi:transcriptional regulator with XRE-family HTH domain